MPTIGGSAAPRPLGYAPGGTPGAYLARSGTADSTWATAVLGGDRPYQSGQWYHLAYSYSNAANTVALAAGYTFYAPCYFAAAVKIAKVGIYAAACTAGAQFNLGVWFNNTGTNKPAAMLAGLSTTAGTAPCAITVTPASALALSAGWYWFGAACASAWTQTSDSPQLSRTPHGTNFDNIATAAQNANSQYTGLQYNAAVTLSSDPATTLATGAQYSSQVPAFYFQVA